MGQAQLIVSLTNLKKIAGSLGFSMDVNFRDVEKKTPLSHAALGNHVDVARDLMQKGAEIDSMDICGSTPLILASYSGNKEIVEYLISAGAGIDIANYANQTALTVALLEGHKDVASILIANGADKERPLRYLLRFGKFQIAGYLSNEIAELVNSRKGILVLGDGEGLSVFKAMKGYVGGVYTEAPDDENFISIAECPEFINRIYVQVESEARYLRYFLSHAHIDGLIDREIILYKVRGGNITELNRYTKALSGKICEGYKIEMPQAIEVDPVNRCNLKCTMCHVSYMETPKLEMLDETVIEHLGGIKNCFVQIGGSYEPTVNKHFLRMTQLFAGNGCELSLITNASLLNDELIDELSKMKFYSILISIDSAVKETYEKIRRGGKYDQVVRNIRLLREKFKGKDTIFLLNMVIMRSNIEELREMVDFAEGVGVDSLGFMNMVIRFDNEDLMNESLDPIMDHAFKRLDDAAEYVITGKKKVIVTSSYYSYTDLKKRYPKNVKSGAIISDNGTSRSYFNKYTAAQLGKHPQMMNDCVSPFTFAKIQNDGDVNVCRDYIVGNVKRNSLEEVWFGEKAKYVRNFIIENPLLCETCEHYRYCLKPGTMDVYDPSNVGGKVNVARVEDHLGRMKLDSEDMANPPFPEFVRFIGAVRTGDLEVLHSIADKGIDVEARDNNGNTALIHATLVGNNEIVEYLLSRGVDVSATNKYADSSLTIALLRGHREIADKLIARGADVNTALQYASNHHQKAIVEYLLDCGADVDVRDQDLRTPLFHAVTSNNRDMAGYLLGRGANAGLKDKDGLAPLIHAIICGHGEIAKMLISAGADVDQADDNGSTALIHASIHGLKGMIELLTANGANVNAENKYEDRPLTVALLRGHPEVAELLISLGADVGATLKYASIHDRKEIADFFSIKKNPV